MNNCKFLYYVWLHKYQITFTSTVNNNQHSHSFLCSVFHTDDSMNENYDIHMYNFHTFYDEFCEK